MANCKINLTDCDPKYIADKLREQANHFHKPFPWRVTLAFIGGMILVAAMDYGDVWLCVGQCNAHIAQEG